MGFKIGHQVGEWDHEFQNYPIMVAFLIFVLKVCIFFSKLPYNSDLYVFRYKTLFFILKFRLLFYFFVAFDTQNLLDFRYKTLFFTYNFLYFFNVSYNFFVSYPLMIPSGSSQLTSTREGEARVVMGGWVDGWMDGL